MSVFLSRIALLTVRSCPKSNLSINNAIETFMKSGRCFSQKTNLFFNQNHCFSREYATDVIVPTAPLDSKNVLLKKKTVHKQNLEHLSKKEGHYLTLAYATADSYDLKNLKDALVQQKLYEPGTLKSNDVGDVVVATPVYPVGTEPREIIFFKEGAVVFWNCSELEATNVLDFLRPYELESYPRDVVMREKEIMTYVYPANAKKCHLQESGFILVPNRDNSLERYTFSHAMAQSARLGAWEARLGELAAAIRAHTGAMERGTDNVEKKEIVQKLGELFSLRHRLTVESDLLDTPDVYWEQEQLERLYSGTVAYFTIPRRTRVLNERLAHCVELLGLLSTWAADRHHVRLEWFIIALILIEVMFELLHFAERLPQERRISNGLKTFNSEYEENMFQDLTVVDTYG